MLRFFLVAIVCFASICAATAAEFPAPDQWEQRNWLIESKQRSWLSSEHLAEGWIQLTGDREHFGWQATGETVWRFCGASDAFANTREDKGWLMTTTEWADFELIVDYSASDPKANSGIFIRSPSEPKDPATDCYEINIAPQSNPFPTGSIVGRLRATYAEGQERQLKEERRALHRMHITAEEGRIQVKLDGELVADYTDPNPIAKGFIGLQHNEGMVLFKRVLLRPLGTNSIFNGQDLAGWETDRAGPAKFEVTGDGELHVTGGSGQMESEGEYGNFVFQFDCKVNGDRLNSGIFFRSIPGEKMNGYECQIHNGYKESDLTQPTDFGTGGIYRRTPARLVSAKDHEWFPTTLHANGPRFAIWVNGIQVTDWTDTRAPDENPRGGLRLKPGTFCIQAHDPTTDLLFRNLRIVELP